MGVGLGLGLGWRSAWPCRRGRQCNMHPCAGAGAGSNHCVKVHMRRPYTWSGGLLLSSPHSGHAAFAKANEPGGWHCEPRGCPPRSCPRPRSWDRPPSQASCCLGWLWRTWRTSLAAWSLRSRSALTGLPLTAMSEKDMESSCARPAATAACMRSWTTGGGGREGAEEEGQTMAVVAAASSQGLCLSAVRAHMGPAV